MLSDVLGAALKLLWRSEESKAYFIKIMTLFINAITELFLCLNGLKL